MKAIAYQHILPLEHPEYLLDIETATPSPEKNDILVEIKAIAVNPVDLKIRQRVSPPEGEYKILGWDAAGVVIAKGSKVSRFNMGDEVWYAGALQHPGCNAQYQCVNQNIVALKPQNLSFTNAAALPLTGLTAWELLFDRMQIPMKDAGTLLITGAAGGVGSIMIQLAKVLTGLTVIATASRPITQQWVKQMGADRVIDHHQALKPQLKALDIEQVDYVCSLTHTQQHFSELAECLAPQGKLGLIDDPEQLDIRLLKQKSISLYWEFMYTRSMFNTPDIIRQHDILSELAILCEQHKIASTLHQQLGIINASNLKQAHQLISTGQSLGKIVLEGF